MDPVLLKSDQPASGGLRPWISLVMLFATLVGVIGCGVDEYVDASKQTWSALKQFDEDEKKLGGPAEIPVLERQLNQGVVKGPLVELCFRPPAGLGKAPVFITPPTQPLKVLQYTPADGKPSGGISSIWLVVRPGRDIEPMKKELAQASLFSLGEGTWDKLNLKSAGTRGSLAVEWFKPAATKAAQPAAQPVPTPTQPANPKGKGPATQPKAAQPKAPPVNPNPAAIAFILKYESPTDPAALAIVYQPVPGMEGPARDLALRSVATARTLAAAASERNRLTRKKAGPAGAPAGAPGTPAAAPPGGAP